MVELSPLEAEVNELLYTVWDPIGVTGRAPKDEYASYAREIAALIWPSPKDLADYLVATEIDQMMMRGNHELAQRAAEAIFPILQGADPTSA